MFFLNIIQFITTNIVRKSNFMRIFMAQGSFRPVCEKFGGDCNGAVWKGVMDQPSSAGFREKILPG